VVYALSRAAAQRTTGLPVGVHGHQPSANPAYDDERYDQREKVMRKTLLIQLTKK
jgi:hypothetical protein